MNNVMVSVVMAVYNGEKHVRKAVDGIINQTYRNLEMIILNGTSTDATAEILENYKQQDSRIKVLTNNVNKKLWTQIVQKEKMQGIRDYYVLYRTHDELASSIK